MGMQTTLSATLKLKKYQILPQKTVSCQPYALTRTGVRCMGRLSGLVENFIWCFKVKCAADNFVWAYADNFASDGAPQALGRELCLTDGALRGRRLCLGRCVLGRQLWLEPYMHGQSHIWLLLAENIVYPGDWDGPKTTFSRKEGYPRQQLFQFVPSCWFCITGIPQILVRCTCTYIWSQSFDDEQRCHAKFHYQVVSYLFTFHQPWPSTRLDTRQHKTMLAHVFSFFLFK